MLRRIRTFIHSEARAIAALALVTAVTVLAVVGSGIAGDTRAVRVVNVFPTDGDAVPMSVADLTVTFDRPVDRSLAEAAFAITPHLAGTVSWRGNTLRYTFAAPPLPGTYAVDIHPGELGRRGERLREPVSLSFSVRKPAIVIARDNDRASSTLSVFDDGSWREIATIDRAWGLAVSPDGAQIAIAQSTPSALFTSLLDAATGTILQRLGDEQFNVFDVAWGPSSLLAVTRSERLAGNEFGVGRVWFMRTNGEFAAAADESGEPTLRPSWAPGSQWFAYVAPTAAELRLRNMATGEVRPIGTPRGSGVAWSPGGQLLAFESIFEPVENEPLRQPIRVVSVDGAADVTLGEPNEVRASPVFIDDETVASARWTLGDTTGAAIVFESLATGAIVREIALPGPGFVRDIERSPSGDGLLVLRDGAAAGQLQLIDIATGAATTIAEGVTLAAWRP